MREYESSFQQNEERDRADRVLAKLQARVEFYAYQEEMARQYLAQLEESGAAQPLEVTFYTKMLEQLQAKRAAIAEALDLVTAEFAEQVSLGESPASAQPPRTALPEALPASTERPKTAEKERVAFTGTIAHPPRFEITKTNHIHKLSFSVAEHPDATSTIYRQVSAYRVLADAWNGKLAKGDPVQVVAYTTARQGKTRDGEPKTVTEYNATAIVRRR